MSFSFWPNIHRKERWVTSDSFTICCWQIIVLASDIIFLYMQFLQMYKGNTIGKRQLTNTLIISFSSYINIHLRIIDILPTEIKHVLPQINYHREQTQLCYFWEQSLSLKGTLYFRKKESHTGKVILFSQIGFCLKIGTKLPGVFPEDCSTIH